jgi:glycosyltransferase involved in cell wall biosynthesis
MRRILIFSLAYFPQVGGAEVAIKEITDRLTDIEFHLLTLRFGKDLRQEKIGNITVHRIGNGHSYLSKILFIPRAAFAAQTLHRTYAFDTFWAMMSYMLLPIVFLRFAGIKVPYVLTLQEGDPWNHMFRRWFILPVRPLLSYGFRQATVVTAISTYLSGWAKRMGYRGTVRVIPNGVDIERFRSVGIHSGIREPVTLITASRLVKKNAVDDIIRALALLPLSRLQICGTGPEEKKLRKLAERPGIYGRVEFLGHVGHDRLPELLSHADIFIRPSRSEGMGNVFLEAMVAGLPVIATQEGGIADFLFDAKRNPDKETTGWAVDVNAPEQIADAVIDIVTHPEQVVRVTAAAKHLAIAQYDWNLIAKNMRAVFEEVFASR